MSKFFRFCILFYLAIKTDSLFILVYSYQASVILWIQQQKQQ